MKLKSIKKKRGKRGIAPIVATVLLISLTIILAAIISLWVWKFIFEQIEKFGGSAEEACNQISFDAGLSPGGTAQTYILSITNNGKVPINEIDRKDISGGKSAVTRMAIMLGSGESKDFEISLEPDVESITLIPVLLGTVKGTSNRKSFKCAENLGKTLARPT